MAIIGKKGTCNAYECLLAVGVSLLFFPATVCFTFSNVTPPSGKRALSSVCNLVSLFRLRVSVYICMLVC